MDFITTSSGYDMNLEKQIEEKDTEITKLKQKNQELEQEIESLKLNDVALFSKEIDEIFQKNNELKAQNSDLSTKIMEQNKKIELIIETNKELHEKLEKEKASAESYIRDQVENLNKQMDQKQDEYDAKINEYERKIKSLNEKLRNIISQKDSISKMIEIFMQKTAQITNTPIRTFDDIFLFIEEMQNKQIPEKSVIDNSETSEIKKLKRKISKLKQYNQETKAANKSQQEKFNSLIFDLQKSKENSESTINSLKSLIRKMENDQKIKETDYDFKIQTLTDMNNELQKQINNFQQQNDIKDKTPTESELNDQEEMHQLAFSNNKLNIKVANQKKQIKQLKNELKKYSQNVKEAKDNQKLSKLKITHLTEEKSKLEKDSITAKVTIDEMKNDIEMLEDNCKSLKENLDKSRNENTQLKEKIKSLDNSIANYKDKITSLQDEKNLNENLILSNKNHNEELEQANRNLKIKIQELEDKIEKESATHNTKPVVEVIPSNVWNCTDFPNSLSKTVFEIGSNNSISTSNKIKQSMNTIATYFNNIIEKLNSTIKETETQYAKILNVIKSAIYLLNGNFDEQNITSEYIESLIKNIEDQFNQIKKDMRNQEDSLKKEILQKEKQISTQTEKLNSILSHCKHYKSLNKKLKKHVESKQLEFNTIIQNYEHETNKQRKQLNEAEEKLDEHIYKVAELETLLKHKEEIISNLKSEKTNSQPQIKTLNSINDNEKDKEKDRIINSLQKSLEEINIKFENAKQFIKILKQRNNKLVDALNNNEKKQLTEIEQIKENHNYAIRNMQRETQSETEKLRNENLRKDENIEKNKQQIVILQTKNDNLEKEKRELEEEKNQLIDKMEKIKKKAEREKNFADMKRKLEMHAEKEKMNDMIENAKFEFEQKKKAIIYFAVEHLKQFYDPKNDIDEKAFKEIIQKAEMQLKKV